MGSSTKNLIHVLFACTIFSVSALSVAQSNDDIGRQQSPEAEVENPETKAQNNSNRSDMTFLRLTDIVGKYTGKVDTDGSSLSFIYNEVPMTLIANEAANRMRIVTPILEADQISPEQMLAISLANFHLALDGRYALGGNMLYAAYIHPLKELTAEQVESAIRQVSMLRITFGTSYTSGEMSFGAVRSPQGQDI